MTLRNSPRPWYIIDAACDGYAETIRSDKADLEMLRTLKILRSIIVSLGIIGIAGYAVGQGGDPTILGTLALLTLGLYNGLELTDYLALLRAYNEVQSADSDD